VEQTSTAKECNLVIVFEIHSTTNLESLMSFYRTAILTLPMTMVHSIALNGIIWRLQMPNPGSDAPLRKVTLNLYESDVTAATAYYGTGWTTELRRVWQEHMRQTTIYAKHSKTLGDLS
jgi:hypothetical protein